MEKQITLFQKETRTLHEQVNMMIVDSEPALKTVSDLIAKVKAKAKEIKGEKDKFCAPAKEIITQAKEKYDPFIEQCDELERLLKKKAENYLIEEKRRADKELLSIEKKVASGYIKPETAIAKIEKIGATETTMSTGKSSISMTMRKDIEITDESLIPREYLVVDLVKLKKALLAGVSVNGAKVVEVPVMSSRQYATA